MFRLRNGNKRLCQKVIYDLTVGDDMKTHKNEKKKNANYAEVAENVRIIA